MTDASIHSVSVICSWQIVSVCSRPWGCFVIAQCKGNQSWIFTGGTDADAETPKLWPSHAKSQPIGKDSDAGKDWRQEEKEVTEHEMIGWHHWLKGHEFEMLQFMRLQRVRHGWTTEQQQEKEAMWWILPLRTRVIFEKVSESLWESSLFSLLTTLKLPSFLWGFVLFWILSFFWQKKNKEKKKNTEVCILISCLVYGKKSYSCAHFSQRPRTVSEI